VKSSYNLGNALSRQGRHEEAVRAFERATAIDPSLAIAHSNRGASLLALRRLDEAEAAYRLALAVDPTLVTSRASLAAILYMKDRLDEALAEAEAALALDPAPADAAQIRELADRIRGRLRSPLVGR
jgi:tetratricopeptide (TPR) repeat protein